MEPAPETSDRGFSSHVVTHAHDECVKVFGQEILVCPIVAHAIGECPIASKGSVAHRDDFEVWMPVTTFASTFTDDAVSGYAHAHATLG
jgi:hypothetical protein